VLFDFDRAVLRQGEMSKLDGVIAAFNSGGYNRVGVVGYADRVGPEQYNLVLSQRRADAVSAYLSEKGVSYQVIRTEARGESGSTTGDQCKNMGQETKRNRKLIECLQPDRRGVITVMESR
jgi:OOP family OmpA-OmpF porin